MHVGRWQQMGLQVWRSMDVWMEGAFGFGAFACFGLPTFFFLVNALCGFCWPERAPLRLLCLLTSGATVAVSSSSKLFLFVLPMFQGCLVVQGNKRVLSVGIVQYLLVIKRTFFCGESLPGCLGSFNLAKLISEICLVPNRSKHSFLAFLQVRAHINTPSFTIRCVC